MFQFNSLEEAIRHEIELWVSQTIPKLKAKLDKNHIGNTDELKKSIDAQFVMEQGNLSAKVFFQYVVHGKFQDMERWNFTSLPDVESLKKWVLSVGIGKFSYIPGYENAKSFPTTSRAAARIAWGIATKWNMQGKVARKKRWQPLKTIYNTLPSIRDTIAKKIMDFGYQSIKNALE